MTLRLVGGRRAAMHTRRVTVERTPVPWALYALAMWCVTLGWLMAYLLPHPGFPVAPLVVAAVATVVSVVVQRRGRQRR